MFMYAVVVAVAVSVFSTASSQVSDAEALERLQNCCAAVMKPECRHLCKYTSQKETNCVGELKKWMYCAADGHRNRGCCRNKGIDSVCNDFCDGDAPRVAQLSRADGFKFLANCVPDSKANTILECHKDNLDSTQNWKEDIAKNKLPDFSEDIPEDVLRFLKALPDC